MWGVGIWTADHCTCAGSAWNESAVWLAAPVGIYRQMTSHLIHIGYPKTASTFLQRWFAAHPSLGYAEWSLAGFEDVFGLAAAGYGPEAVRWRVTSFEGFAAPLPTYMVFDSRFPEKLLPSRGSQEKVSALLADLFPNAKILLVTRGFRPLVLSTYSELVRGGLDCTFRTYCASLARSVRAGANPFDYDFLIELYARRFGRENLIVLPYELLGKEPGAFLGRLEQELAIPPFSFAPERVHPSFSPEELHWYPRIARFLRSLPLTRRRRQKLFERHVAAARVNRWRAPIRLLQRIRPGPPVTADQVPFSLLKALSGGAGELRANPLYRDFGCEYSFADVAAAPPSSGG